MINIALIEDDSFMLEIYSRFFNADANFNVIFSVGDVNELRQVSNTLQPDIILLDLLLPSGNSLNYLHRIRQYFPFAQIIILSSVTDSQISQRAMKNGADGFLLKSSSLDFIKESLLKAVEGGTPLSPMVANHILQGNRLQTMTSVYPKLTRRETQLIDLLKTGVSNKVAASMLNITYFTINQHLKNIYTKLSVNSKSELVSIAMRYAD
jgi:DNA-binding NarL/FixJ family response regulator